MKYYIIRNDDCDYKQLYLDTYGHHFNKCLYNFAVDNMYTILNNTKTKLDPLKKDYVDALLSKYDIHLLNNKDWDYMYVANMCKSDFYGDAIENEMHLVRFIHDMIDDIDAPEGFIMNRWCADCELANIDIPWNDVM